MASSLLAEVVRDKSVQEPQTHAPESPGMHCVWAAEKQPLTRALRLPVLLPCPHDNCPPKATTTGSWPHPALGRCLPLPILLSLHSSLSPVPKLELEEVRPQNSGKVGFLHDCCTHDPPPPVLNAVSLRGKPYHHVQFLFFGFWGTSSCSEAP